jgi:hypothetical protein
MTPTIKGQIDERGFAFVPEHLPDLDTPTIAGALGSPVTPWGNRLVQQLVPRRTATPNTYSGIYGLNRFPFHTDLAHWRLPPRYLLLRCVKGYHDVTTQLIDGKGIISVVTLDTMTRAVVRPRRPQQKSIPLMRLCEQVEGGYRLRWDEVFLKPASRIGEAASQKVREVLATYEALSIPLADRADTLVIDNWRMLHARSPIPAGHEDRVIERVYLEGLH